MADTGYRDCWRTNQCCEAQARAEDKEACFQEFIGCMYSRDASRTDPPKLLIELVEQAQKVVLGLSQASAEAPADADEAECKEVEGAASFVKGGGAMANVSSKVSLAQVQAPPSEDKKWDELSSEEKDGARKLGYGKQKWDGDDWVASEGKKWEELDQAEQEGAAALGWNQASWNEDYPCKSLEAHIRKLEKMEKEGVEVSGSEGAAKEEAKPE